MFVDFLKTKLSLRINNFYILIYFMYLNTKLYEMPYCDKYHLKFLSLRLPSHLRRRKKSEKAFYLTDFKKGK